MEGRKRLVVHEPIIRVVRTGPSFTASEIEGTVIAVDLEFYEVRLWGHAATSFLPVPVDEWRAALEAATLHRQLAARCGFTPYNVKEERGPYTIEHRPRWWHLLRRLGLRVKRRSEFIRLRVSAITALTPEYEIEMMQPEPAFFSPATSLVPPALLHGDTRDPA